MKYTLLEMVQSILNELDSDEVNSITDTTEAFDIANTIRDVFYEVAVEINLPEHETLFELTATTDPLKPVLMTVPNNVVRLDWVKYDNKLQTETYQNFLDVCFVPFEEFLTRQQSLASFNTEAFRGTSTSSVAIGTGSKTFVTQANKTFPVGSTVIVESTVNPTTQFMSGTVTSYSGTTLVVNVTTISGSGTLASWTIRRTDNVNSFNLTTNGEIVQILFTDDAMPSYYTTVGENQLVFNSYDKTQDATLQKSKSLCHGLVYPTFSLTDSFVPGIDATQFPYLLNKAKARCFLSKKQISNAGVERAERHQKIVVQKRKYTHKTQIPGFNSNLARYGRK